MSGPELGETLLQTRRDIRLIFMSAFAGGSQLVLNHGWAFIEKPFVTQKLLEMINSILHSPNKSVPPPKVQLTFDGQRQASAAVIDGCDDVLSCTESKRAMADGFDLVVHSLNGAIGDALLGPR